VSIKCLTIVQAIGGEFPRFFRLFFYILVPGIYGTKTMKKCLQFEYIFAELLPVKCQTKFLILAVKCLTNCLLAHSIFFLIVCSMPVEKLVFFGEQLFDKNSNFPQTFCSKLAVQTASAIVEKIP
jgi:hypothetical protein